LTIRNGTKSRARLLVNGFFDSRHLFLREGN
jgi:hypothetical protein